MLKNKINKYFTVEIIKSFLTILFAFTAIAWTVRAVNFLDLIVENGHSIKTYFQFSLLNITNIITKFIPLSFLLALVLSIVKFQRQNELIILWTSGLNKIKVANLFLFISMLILILQIIFAVFVTPNALHKSRSLIKSSNLGSISSIIKINGFSDSFKGITFYVESKNKKNIMKNIFIRDESGVFKDIIADNNNSSNITIIAKTGYLDKKKLILFDGVIQSQNKDKKLQNITFSKTELLVNSLNNRSIIVPKMQETQSSLLLNCLFKKGGTKNVKILYNCPKNNMKQEVVETMARRVGMPIYIPLISLICCFLLISNNTKKFKFLKKYIYFLIGFVILIAAEILVRYSGFSNIHTFLYFATPIILMPIIYMVLLSKLSSEKVRP